MATSTLHADPLERLAQSPMSRQQIVAVAITVLLNALDGFDVLSISFASPGIAREWGVRGGALGLVLGAELFGMAFGSICLGRFADRIGRRPTILICLCIMAGGMLSAAAASTIADLGLCRVVTGIGIGGMLAATNAAAAEHSNARRKVLSISLMAIGYPIGAALGGAIVTLLLRFFDWRSIFVFGGAMTIGLVPIVLYALPETIPFLMTRNGRNAGAAVDHVLARLGHPPGKDGYAPSFISQASVKQTLGKQFRPATALLATAYFCHAFTFYYTLKWTPKIVVDAGFSASQAAGVLAWGNVGGAVGGLLFGVLARRLTSKGATLVALLGSSCALAVFGLTPRSLAMLSFMIAVVGLFSNAGIVGLYTICVETFPVRLRASGTGSMVGVGRGGSIISPIVAGLLFGAALPLVTISTVMAVGSLLALFFVARLTRAAPSV